MIEFSDGVADHLVSTLRGVIGFLEGQSSSRVAMATAAMRDFKGVYAELVEYGAQQEAVDRRRLVDVLYDLVDQVVVVKARAQEERDRLRALSLWQEREDERRWARRVSAATGGVLPDFAAWDVYDPKPSEVRVRPPHLYAVFRFSPRPRVGGAGSAGGVSSADPQALLSFVSVWRGLDQRTFGELVRLGNAWLRFAAACPWAEVDHVKLPYVFRELREESEAWTAWVGRIAAGFQVAGSQGALGHASVGNAYLAGLLPATGGLGIWGQALGLLAAAIGAQAKDPYAVAQWWDSLSSVDQDLLQTHYPVLIGNMDGIPQQVRGACNMVALDQAIAASDLEIAELEKQLGHWMVTPVPPGPFRGTLLDQQLEQAKARQKDLVDLKDQITKWNTDVRTADSPLTLLGFRSDTPHVQAVVAVGDLSAASNIITHVPGMTTTVGGDTVTKAMQSLNLQGQLAQRQLDQSGVPGPVAGVFFLGYGAPNWGETLLNDDNSVLRTEAAKGCGEALVRYSQGLEATSKTTRLPVLTLSAHSYGTEAGFYALADEGHRFDRAVFSGSPGYPKVPLHLDQENLFIAANPNDFVVTGPELIAPASPHGTPVRYLQNVNHITTDEVEYDGQTFASTTDKVHSYTSRDQAGELVATSTDLHTALIAVGASNLAADESLEVPRESLPYLKPVATPVTLFMTLIDSLGNPYQVEFLGGTK